VSGEKEVVDYERNWLCFYNSDFDVYSSGGIHALNSMERNSSRATSQYITCKHLNNHSNTHLISTIPCVGGDISDGYRSFLIAGESEMREESVRAITMLMLAFTIGFKSIILFLQHYFRFAFALFLLAWTCICLAFPDNLIGASIGQDLKLGEVIRKWRSQ